MTITFSAWLYLEAIDNDGGLFEDGVDIQEEPFKLIANEEEETFRVSMKTLLDPDDYAEFCKSLDNFLANPEAYLEGEDTA